MGATNITKGIVVVLLFGTVAIGRGAADPPPWAGRNSHDRYDSDRGSTWRGARPTLSGTLRGRYRGGDRTLTLRANDADYRVNVSRAEMVGVRDISEGARVLVWGDLRKGRRIDATRVVVISASRPSDDRWGHDRYGSDRYGSDRYGSDRQGRGVVLEGVVDDLDSRGGTFRLRSNRFETYTVIVNRDTRILSSGKSASWGDVREGGRVRVEGILTRSTTLQARTLEGFGR